MAIYIFTMGNTQAQRLEDDVPPEIFQGIERITLSNLYERGRLQVIEKLAGRDKIVSSYLVKYDKHLIMFIDSERSNMAISNFIAEVFHKVGFQTLHSCQIVVTGNKDGLRVEMMRRLCLAVLNEFPLPVTQIPICVGEQPYAAFIELL